MLLKRWFIMLVLILPLAAAAQVEESLEDWLQEDASEAEAAETSDLMQDYIANKVNINDTVAMAEVPFISPFQLKALRNYITLHGQLLSLKELAFIPGFDSTTIGLLEMMTVAEPNTDDGKWQWWRGRHNVVAGLGGTVERAAGYRDSSYAGDNLHALICYKYNYRNHISVRLVADKDPMEQWGKANYYGYHLMLTDIGRLEKLIVGRYNLQFGQGLTMWSGLRPFNLLGQSPVRFGSGVRQASAFYEEGYQEGVAATVDIGHGIHLSAFGSRADGENLVGGHATYRHGNLIVGFTGVYTVLDDSLTVHDYVYNQNYFRGKQLGNFGMDMAWQWRRLTLYGEGAISSEGRPAAIAGAMLTASGDTRFGVSYRYYHPQYHNLHAQGYAIGSTQGEQGVTFDAETRLPLAIVAVASADIHSFPSMRYGSYSPSSGTWLRVRLNRRFGRHVEVSLRYTYRQKERNVPNIDSTVYIGEQTVRRQAQGEIAANAGHWRFVSRAIYAQFDSHNGEPQKGWLVAQSARYTHKGLQATAAAAWFDVDSYYARLYLSESNLQYAWSMPMLTGRGVRASATLRYALNREWSLAAKYALTWYPGQESIGSGAAQTEGPRRQTWFVQVRCSF
ncbi:MAG: hypothetical protein IKP21_07165 [Bacteroidales bacterium]|nr:hypothetical protein [Bacteroidales bacterium]